MSFLVNHPILTFVVTIVVLWMSSGVGAALRVRRADMVEEERGDYGVLLTAMLTLLGLIIGFSFSMASSRYDQRKNLEEEEANAIGTEYVRADLLPADSAEKVRSLLRGYLDQRILFYTTHGDDQLRQINATTAKLQAQLWDAVKAPAGTDRSSVEALTVSGMNDVLNSQGYTQAAWWNRIPIGAWGLMWAIAICCNAMIGFYIRPKDPKNIQFVMPAIIAVAFLLLADIDSPRRGIIKVHPQNLISLLDSLGPR
jgi:protein-S-isoprenylcysteine O-methyltransferase Ste14